MPYEFCTRLTAKIQQLGHPRRHAERLAPIVENVERIRERQAASRQETGGLCERLMATAFPGELSTECS